MFTNLVALTAGLAATASAFDCSGPYFSFYNRGGDAMSFQRIDTALFPGTESPHLHSFDGGNAVSKDMTFDSLQGSSCTTARIKQDKSLYWRPTLFWNGNNTGFYRVPDKFLKVYYKFGDSGNVRANVTEFPENFQMIAGDAMKRSDGDNPAGITWACLGDNYSRIEANGFPKGFTSCKEGLATQLTFPACWNGNDIDPKKPSAHMAYPTNSGTGLEACPEGFRTARFPSIFIEFWYDVSAFDGQYSANDVPWVLAMGDPTGFGFHADFRNGWEKGVLAKATAETGYCNCGCGCGNDQMKQCFGDENVNDDSDADFKSCSAAKVEFPGDDKSPLDKLPGCNPLQSGPAAATAVTGPDCTAAAGPSSGGNKSSAVASASATPAPQSSAAGVSKGASSAGVSKIASIADAETSAAPSLTISLNNKGNGEVSEGGDDYPTSATKSSHKGNHHHPSSAPSLSPITSAASPAGTSALANGEGECSTPTTITITPTVYVTAGAVGANATSCDPGTVYETVTQKATVTVSAGSSYVKPKRHADFHKH